MIRIQLKILSIRPGPRGYRPIKFHRNPSIASRYSIEMQKSGANPVPGSEIWSGSGSKVNQFVHVPISVDTQHASWRNKVYIFNPISCTRFLVILLTDRQTDRQTDKRTKGKRYTSSFVGSKWWCTRRWKMFENVFTFSIYIIIIIIMIIINLGTDRI